MSSLVYVTPTNTKISQQNNILDLQLQIIAKETINERNVKKNILNTNNELFFKTLKQSSDLFPHTIIIPQLNWYIQNKLIQILLKYYNKTIKDTNQM